MAVLTVHAAAPRMDYHPNAQTPSPKRENSAPAAEQEFLFVNASSSASNSQLGQYKGHRDVRRFVMQKARRARPWSTSKQRERQAGAAQSRRVSRKRNSQDRDASRSVTPLSNQETPTEIDLDPMEAVAVRTGRPRCEACGLPSRLSKQGLCTVCWREYTHGNRPREFIAAGAFDPFGTLPVSGDSQSMDPDLWDQFRQMASVNPIPVDVRSQSDAMWSVWTSAALKHTAFLHSLLCAAALNRYFLGQGSYFGVTYHKSKAIAEINASLSNPAVGLTDENIGAVFTLLCIEMSAPNPGGEHNSQDEEVDQVLVHLNGLRRMVDLRGGLGSLKSNKCLESFILRHSILNSIASFDPPYLLPYDSGGNFCSYISPSYHHIHSSNKFVEHLRHLCVDEALTEAVADIVAFIATLNEWYAVPSRAIDPLDLQNQSGVLQCRLMQWLNDEFSAARRPVDSAVCISLIIILVITTESSEPSYRPLHYQAIPRLKEALLSTTIDDWMEAPELLLWTLAVGALCVGGSTDSSFFSDQMSAAVHKCHISSYDRLKLILQDILWVPFKLDGGARLAWTDIMNPRRLSTSCPQSTTPHFAQISQYPFLLGGRVPQSSQKPPSTPALGSRSPKDAFVASLSDLDDPLLFGLSWDSSGAFDIDLDPIIADFEDLMHSF